MEAIKYISWPCPSSGICAALLWHVRASRTCWSSLGCKAGHNAQPICFTCLRPTQTLLLRFELFFSACVCVQLKALVGGGGI